MADTDKEAHLKWCLNSEERHATRMDELRCAACGCIGNCECGHKPLNPDRRCSLDIGDEHESGRCYCCRAMEMGEG